MTHQRIALAIRRTAKREEAGAAVLGQPGAGNRVALPVTDGPAPKAKNRRNAGCHGAGEGIRTLDPNLGKVVLYP